jgi:hypothetical protein
VLQLGGGTLAEHGDGRFWVAFSLVPLRCRLGELCCFIQLAPLRERLAHAELQACRHCGRGLLSDLRRAIYINLFSLHFT